MTESLHEFISRYVQLTKSGAEYRSRCPYCDDPRPDALIVGPDTWRTLCCGAHEEVDTPDAIGWLQRFEGLSREDAAAKLGNGALPDPSPIAVPPLLKLPMFGMRQLAKRPDARVWIHGYFQSVDLARKWWPDRVHLGIIPGREWKHLGDLKGRDCILLGYNTEAQWSLMHSLAAALPAKRVRIIDIRQQEEYWSLLDAEAAGWDAARALTWLGDHAVEIYNAATAGAGNGPPSTEGPLVAAPLNAPPTDGEPPAPPVAGTVGGAPENAPDQRRSEDQPQAIPEAQPPAKRKPALGVVDGNAIRAPVTAADPDQLPAFSEFALAESFAKDKGLDWRYTAAWGTWAQWDGNRWKQDERKQITFVVKECCKATMEAHKADSTPAQRLRLLTLKTVNAVMGVACAEPGIAVLADQWDADPMLLGTPAGVIDLRTGTMIPGKREQMICKATSVAPAVGPHPWWDKVLQRAHRDNADMLGFIHRWCGYLLTGDTREERFLFIHGPGAGGKSKFLSVISEIMGDYRRTAKMESFTAKDRSEHSEEIARLAGARMVTATETEEGSRWNESRIKALTGRDAIAARHMHKSTFEFQPQFKLIFVGNHRPALRTVGEEMRRRIDLIEWGGTIPEVDRVLDLSDKLRAEYPAILTWMIDGCLAWQAEGLGKPAQVANDTAEYLRAEDTTGAWLEECTDADAQARVKSGDAYANFKLWAEAAGEFVPSQKRFTQRLLDRGFGMVKSGDRYFCGLSLRTRAEYS